MNTNFFTQPRITQLPRISSWVEKLHVEARETRELTPIRIQRGHPPQTMDIALDLRQNPPGEIARQRNNCLGEARQVFTCHRQSRGDKSAFLATAGYNAANPEQLLHDLRTQVLSQEAVLLHRTKFGQFYEIRAELIGPNQAQLRIRSIWMKEHLSGETKFITLVPDRKK